MQGHFHHHQQQAGFSMVETLIGAAAAVFVGIGIFAILNAGSMLSARNLALNTTSNALRTSLDRAEQLIQQADSMPVLIDTAGNATTGPAAGVRFDRFVGAPYVITVPGAGIPSTSTSLALQRSTNAMASPPVPQAGDVVRIDGEATTLRPRVSSVSAGTIDASLHQTLTTTLTAALGTTVTNASTIVTAKLVRNVAIIVMPNGARRELRYYPSYDLTTNLNDTTKYTVLTDQVGSLAEDATPFSLITTETKSFVNMSFRVRSNQFDRRLLGKQADQFNTFSRVDVQIRPKVNP